MAIDQEYAYLRALSFNREFKGFLMDLFVRGPESWETRINTLRNQLQKYGLSVAVNGWFQSVVLYPEDSKRKKPACIIVSVVGAALADLSGIRAIEHCGPCEVAYVEKGYVRVARAGTNTEVRGAEESTALHA